MPFQYYGGDVGGKIAQALMMREQLNRQKDLDAVQTGVGLHPYDPSAPENAPTPGFGGRIKQALAKVTGQADPYASQQLDWKQQTGQGPSVSVTPGANGGQGVAAPQPDHSVGPNGYPSQLRLPSGQIVQTAFTPFGERMAQAQMQREYMAAITGMKLDSAQKIASGHDETRVNTTGMNVGGRIQTTAMRNDQSNTNNLRSTNQSNTNNIRSTSTSASNNANTVSAGLTKHNTPSADAIMHLSASGGMNQTVMASRSHLPEATTADALLDQLGPTLSSTAGHGVLSNIGLGQVDPKVQRANQAGEQFVTLVGPMLNHGRMTQQDIEQVRRTYVPQVGDAPEVLKQKSDARKQALTAIQHQARLGTPGASANVGNPLQQPTPAQVQRAQSDPTYAAFLHSKGYSF